MSHLDGETGFDSPVGFVGGFDGEKCRNITFPQENTDLGLLVMEVPFVLEVLTLLAAATKMLVQMLAAQ